MLDKDLKLARTELRHQALRFYADHPNETGRDIVSGSNLAMVRNLGFLVPHPATLRSASLIDTAFTLSPLGERALQMWDTAFPPVAET